MIEIPNEEIKWVKASASAANGQCIEVAKFDEATILLRDSKDPSGPILRFSMIEFEAFIAIAKAGDLDDLAEPMGEPNDHNGED